jgi:hypothetical protein
VPSAASPRATSGVDANCSPRAVLLRSVIHLPEKSGIYHFLINFSSGMGEWYMKVVSESFDSFQLPEFDFFLRCVTHATRVTGGPGSTVSSVIAAIVRRLQVARGRPVSMPPLTDQSEPFGFVCIA